MACTSTRRVGDYRMACGETAALRLSDGSETMTMFLARDIVDDSLRLGDRFACLHHVDGDTITLEWQAIEPWGTWEHAGVNGD